MVHQDVEQCPEQHQEQDQSQSLQGPAVRAATWVCQLSLYPATPNRNIQILANKKIKYMAAIPW